MSTAIVVKIVNGAGAETEQSFSGAFTIGRSKSADFVVNDPAVSRLQARVELDGVNWCIQDLESGNGLFINGSRLSRFELMDCAVIELGQGGPQVSLTVLRQEEPTAHLTHHLRQWNRQPIVTSLCWKLSIWDRNRNPLASPPRRKS